MKEIPVRFILNGKTVETTVKPNETLLDVLRYRLKMTGTKRGCETGECGACTVLLDGKAVNSCFVLAPQVNNREVLTIEGLGSPEKLHPLQQAFAEHSALQCGYCIPGMLLNAKAFLDENPQPTKEEVKEALVGNICRCTGYTQQIEAILDVAGRGKKEFLGSTATSTTIGKRIVRKDAVEKLTGMTKYLDDMDFHGMLHAKMLTSRYAHARILRIDTSKAERVPGVAAVLTGKDIPNNRFGRILLEGGRPDQPVLADDKVRYMGDPVAAVAAETEETAEEAVELIEVEYEELPAVFDPREALKPGAPQIQPGGNLCFHRKIRLGDVEKGFKESDLIFEDSFETPWQEHMYLEPHGAIATVDAGGRVTVLTGTQMPSLLIGDLASVLRMPFSQIRVIGTPTGGGFGGKTELTVEPIVAMFALKTRRPVKMVWSRSEDFISSTHRHRWFINYKTGVKRDGTLVATEVNVVVDGGPYASWGESHMTKGAIFARGPYKTPNVKVDCYLVYTNTILQGAMRGFGVVQVTAARETHLDNIARKLEIDPVELRLKNLVKAGDIHSTGQVLHSVGIGETIVKAVEASGWKMPRKEVS